MLCMQHIMELVSLLLASRVLAIVLDHNRMTHLSLPRLSAPAP